jgi:hypothetical protein
MAIEKYFGMIMKRGRKKVKNIDHMLYMQLCNCIYVCVCVKKVIQKEGI